MGHIYTNTKPTMNPQSLPASIETQLSEMEGRHKRHQAMLDDHHFAKCDRRERHRNRKFTRKVIPILL